MPVLLLSLVVTILAAYLLSMRRAAQQELDKALAELDEEEPGWRFYDIEAGREAIPDDKNSALCVLAARKMLPAGWPDRDFICAFDDSMKDLEPNRQLDEQQYALLLDELHEHQAALDNAAHLAALPRGRYSIVYDENVHRTLLRHLQPVREIADLLRYDAMIRAQDGDFAGALRSCQAIANAGRSIGDEPLTISQLVRFACIAIALRETERVLGQGEAPETELEDLHRILEDERKHPYLLICARGERGEMNESFQAIEMGRITVEELGGNARSKHLEDRLSRPLVNYVILRDHPLVLTLMSDLVAIARRPVEDRELALKQWQSSVQSSTLSGPARLIIPASAKWDDAERRTQAQLRCMIVILAMERYRLKHNGRCPERLEDLTPAFLDELPVDPYDGKPLRFRQLADFRVIYSIGPDHEDNDGKIDLKHLTEPGTDIGFRLWNPDKRRQPAK